jgi:hypothetical protein
MHQIEPGSRLNINCRNFAVRRWWWPGVFKPVGSPLALIECAGRWLLAVSRTSESMSISFVVTPMSDYTYSKFSASLISTLQEEDPAAFNLVVVG